MGLTQAQIDSIQIDYGLLYLNYGEIDQKPLGPTRGGGEFTATKNIRNIEFDGQLGPTMGMQVIDEIGATLKCTVLSTSLETLALGLPQATHDVANQIIKSGIGGVIPTAKYLKNVTMFAKVIGGGYKKITLFNAMAENDLSLKAKPKGEGEVELEFVAHWDPANMVEGSLYTIEDVTTINPPPGS